MSLAINIVNISSLVVVIVNIFGGGCCYAVRGAGPESGGLTPLDNG